MVINLPGLYESRGVFIHALRVRSVRNCSSHDCLSCRICNQSVVGWLLVDQFRKLGTYLFARVPLAKWPKLSNAPGNKFVARRKIKPTHERAAVFFSIRRSHSGAPVSRQGRQSCAPRPSSLDLQGNTTATKSWRARRGPPVKQWGLIREGGRHNRGEKSLRGGHRIHDWVEQCLGGEDGIQYG